MKSSKKNLMVTLGAILMVVTIGITYAFVSQVLTGTKEVVINAGVLDLVLEEENAITISDALPMYDAVGMIQEDVFVFRLVNKTANPTNYVLKLSKINADNELSTSDVKYYLTKEGVGQPKLLSTLPSDGTVDSGTIAGNDTIDYELRLWINSAVTDETAISGKTLSYRVDAEVSQEIAELPTFVGQLENKVDTATTIDFKTISSATNGRGIYKYTEDGEDIYYWRGKVDEVEGAENHVLFANLCWEIVRTTKTGGIKMIYDGVPVEVDGIKTCPNTGEASQLTSNVFNSGDKSPAYVGYMYGNTVYEYQTKTSSDAALTTAGILYGYDVNWTGTEYELKAKDGGSLFSSTGTWRTDKTSVANGNHYTCFDNDGNCETVSYVYYTGDSTYSYYYYIDLSGGTTIEEALEQMYSNEQPSRIKTRIENWFESTELDKEENLSKLEDVVYCNDRSVADVTTNGWSKDGDASHNINYSSITRRSNGTPDLSCRQTLGNRDRFTYKDTVNGNGLLKWPVGLLTADEIMLAGGQNSSNSDYYLYTGKTYWALSPYYISNYGYYEFNVDRNGYLSANTVRSSEGLRPVVSLAAGTTFADGTAGTEQNPYVVE